MCRMSAQDGIEHVVATPHANDRYFYDREYLSGLCSLLRLPESVATLKTLRSIAARNQEAPSFAEALLTMFPVKDPMLRDRIRHEIVVREDRALRSAGRAGRVNDRRGIVAVEWHDRPLRFVAGERVNILRSDDFAGDRARETSEWLLREKAVHFLATDAHDIQRRPPVLSEARKIIAKEYGEELAHALVEENPHAVVSGEPLPYFNQ